MKKATRIFTVLMTVSMLVGILATMFSASAASVFQRQKKNIYLVMDDSGSMAGKGEYDANYALQTLIAMTDKSDSVKLYFLNGRTALSGDLNMANKSNALITDICNRYPGINGDTPYGMVDTAQGDITAAVTEGDNSEYWLVVLTDGGFNEGNPSADLQQFAGTPLKNGRYPNVLFVTIGGDKIDSAGVSNLYTIEGYDIISAMNEAASLISGRINVTDVTYTDSNTALTFDIPYPAKNIVVLTQNNQTSITNHVSSSTLKTDENYTVSYPISGTGIDKSTVCFITENNGSSIAHGQITLKFDNVLDPNNTTVLFEPAIGLVAHYYQEGQEVDPGKLCIGEKVKLEFTICDSETKQPLDESVLGGKVSYSAKINGQDHIGNNVEFDLNTDTVEVDMFAKLPDGFVLDIHNKYEKLKPRRTVSFNVAGGGEFSCDFDQLDKTDGILATVTVNGATPTPEDFKNFDLDVKGYNFITANFKVESDDKTGTFKIIPKKGFISPLTPKDATYKAVLTDKVDGTKYEAELKIKIPGERSWWEIIKIIIIAAVVIYFIIVFATKKYFPWGLTFVYFMDNPAYDDTVTAAKKIKIGTAIVQELWYSPVNFFKHMFIQLLPNQAMQVNLYNIGNGIFKGITFIANSNDRMEIKSPEIIKNQYGDIETDIKFYDPDYIGQNDPSHFINTSNKKHITINVRLNHCLFKEVDYSINILQLRTAKDIKDIGIITH